MSSGGLHLVCHSGDVPDPGCRGFELTIGDKTISGFVVHWQGEWYGYENSCPHTGASMNWQPDQFFDLANEYLVCGLHGAQFQPQNGLCIYGPCVGQSLSILPVIERDGDILLVYSGLHSIQ